MRKPEGMRGNGGIIYIIRTVGFGGCEAAFLIRESRW